MKKIESNQTKGTLKISLSDLWRATLDDCCGNEGYIGLSSDGSRYHVVVPVDRQIARGIKACNLPEDGTPFGGYNGWHYFPCQTYEGADNPNKDNITRKQKAIQNGQLLRIWASTRGIEVELDFNLD